MSSSKMTKNICRTCLSSDGELISLFSAISDVACLPKKIMNISDVLIQEQDDLPYMICKKCIFLVESFDCFKKQVESANKHIKSAWCRRKEKFVRAAKVPKGMVNFCGGEEECDDFDYEIEYISEEVKRDVEIAFKRKSENKCKKRLTKVCTTLKELQDVLLVPTEDIKEKKKTEIVIADHGSKIVTIETDHRGKEETSVNTEEMNTNHDVIVPKDIEQKPPKPEKFDRGEKKQTMTEKSREIDGGTFEIVNSCSANENVTMETKELENIKLKIREPDKSENIEEKILLICELDCGKQEGISELEKTQNIKENIHVLGELDCGNNEEIMETRKANEIVKTIFQAQETDCSDEDADMEIGTPNEIAEKTFQPNKMDCNNQDQSMDDEKFSKTKETILLLQNSKNTNETVIEPEKSNNDVNASELENLNYENNEQFVDVERFDDIEQKPLKLENSLKVEENISEKFIEKGKIIVREKPNDDVIVISSDSSDEERYRAFMKNGMRTENRRSSWLARSSRIKLLQSKVITRKDQMEEKNILKESMNSENIVPTPIKKRQPGKYFQCTTCNINLYSVTAVLYHHNANHTSSHESLSCQMCDKIFLTKNLLFQHFDQHLEAHLYRCSECNCEFVLKRNLRAHVNCHEREKLEEPESKRPKVDDKNWKQEGEITKGNVPKEEKVVEGGRDDCEDSEKENMIFGKSDVKETEMSSDKNVGHQEEGG